MYSVAELLFSTHKDQGLIPRTGKKKARVILYQQISDKDNTFYMHNRILLSHKKGVLIHITTSTSEALS